MTQWRAVLFNHHFSPWRDDRDVAVEDAIEQGWARRDKFISDRVWIDAGVEIESRKARPRIRSGVTEKKA